MMNYGTNFRSPKVDVHKFSMIPRAEIPRSSFVMDHQHKTTIPAGRLIPIFLTEVLPGDSFNLSMTAFCRLNTTLVPILDNLDLESWFFFIPNRILWSHWVNMMGEQPVGPGDSISYSVPQITNIPAGGLVYANSFNLYDYMGIPGLGQLGGGGTLSINALPFRAYNMIWSQWFRDENIQGAVGTGATNTVGDIGDGPDPAANYATQTIAKRHDYFTSCLPWTQKGGVPVSFLSGNAIVQTTASAGFSGSQSPVTWSTSTGTAPTASVVLGINAGTQMQPATNATGAFVQTGLYPTNLVANLGSAAANTINSLRLAFQTQKLLERDARGGTRYQELLMSHFGVHPLDSRVQRPEYLGGGKTPITITPVPQTSATGLTGGTTPAGNLSAVGTLVGHNHGFRGSFTEHGYILGLCGIRTDEVYQQGLHRMWTRQTRYDFYWPVFAMLGEQAVRQDEIYCVGTPATDAAAFGFQERWAEYRYLPSRTSSMFRSTTATPIDYWHLATNFTAAPALNPAFITSPLSTTLARVLAGGASVIAEQLLCDFFFKVKAARPMPMYSVPGLIDHF